MENTRRLERERVLELLYEAEMKGVDVDALLAELPVPAEPFVQTLVKGASTDTDELDAEIAAHSTNWPVERMAAVDRLIMRIGVWELRNRPDTTVAVIISEAVELAKKYSTDESGKFVNGILAAIAETRPPSS
jgi:N utilization substance protein B